jgi:hypothetical protein
MDGVVIVSAVRLIAEDAFVPHDGIVNKARRQIEPVSGT